MLNRDVLKPFFLDPDSHVRDAVASYFSESCDQDPELIPLILRACDRFGIEANRFGLAVCRDFTLPEASLPDVLRTLDKVEDAQSRIHLNRLLARLPVEAFTRHEDAIKVHAAVHQKTLRQLEQRRDCATWPATKLWTELQEFAGQIKDKCVGEFDHQYVDVLVEQLGELDSPSDSEICELLRSTKIEASWLEIFLIDMAGERQLHKAVPQLVERYRVDTDYMLDRCTRALIKINDPDAVRLVQEFFPREDWNFKNFATGLLSGLKLPESEQAILMLLQSEQDLDIRTMLCHGLCRLFSERGIEIVHQQIRDGYKNWLVHLEEELLSVLHVLGQDRPEVPQWERERVERDRVQAIRRRNLNDPARVNLMQLGNRNRSFPQIQEEGDVLDRGTAKIGRNDPCPCGSGKKYKRCCSQP